MRDYCGLVDVFYGNGEVDHFAEKGLASKWFYIKALCGNTIPHATLPFGKMSVGAYSGGYPTGYGNHYPNSCGGIKKLFEGKMARGFSHLHQSGTGGIRYYYNYAVTTPISSEDISEAKILRPLEDEAACPGYYSCHLGDAFCEFTVSGGVAIHHYLFENEGGKIVIDFSNNGLNPVFGDYYRGSVKNLRLQKLSGNEVWFSAELSGVTLYFCALFEGKLKGLSLFCDDTATAKTELSAENGEKSFGAAATLKDKEVYLKLAYSTRSCEAARKEIAGVKDEFKVIVDKAYNLWNNTLFKVAVTINDDEMERRFYSNLYHSLVKPCDMTGETILGVEKNCVSDLATLWDQYKTVYPLIFAFYPEMGEKLTKGIINVSRSLGKIPCSFGTSDVFPCEEQAKMLGITALTDAHHFGIKSASVEAIEECALREFAREDFKSFLENGLFERYTHILDAADACFNLAQIAQNAELKEKLLTLAENFKKAYDGEGLMSEKSPYYEGDRYTYSFRLHPYMEERMALSGGKDNFVKQLDSFFGFGGESLKQITELGVDPANVEPHHHRFEGFNNECDMETPYAYIYADRPDRTCEIIHASVMDSFTSGRGGLPGNNDSGGLSSCYVWNVLGIFPAAGNGEFLIGSPHIRKATLSLSNGNRLDIAVHGNRGGAYITDTVFFNDNPVSNFRIPTEELMKGGKLIINMK